MTRRIDKWAYFSISGETVHKRSNFSPLKLVLLKGLYEMDRFDVRATAYDSKYQDRYYDVATIAKFLYGEKAIEGEGIKDSIRTGHNRSLRALMDDGYATYTGLFRRDGGVYREHVKNHWRITREGIRVLAADYNKCLPSYLRDNRFVGLKGTYTRKNVVKVLWDDSCKYEEHVRIKGATAAFIAQKVRLSRLDQ